MERLGIAFWGGMPVDDLVECVQLAEACGYESAWLIESYADVFSVLSACAAATSSIHLGTGVATVFTRTPMNVAMGAMTVDAVSRGRFRLGLGVGHREIHVVRDDAELGRPLAFEDGLRRLRETAEIVKELLRAAKAGEPVNHHGELFALDGFETWYEPYRDHVPIYFAALSDATKRLVGEVADGVLPIFVPLERVPQLVQLIQSSAEEARRDAKAIDLGCFLPVCVSNDAAQARGALRNMVATHLSHYAFYRNYFRSLGFEDVRVTDDLLEAVGVVGGPAEWCRAKIDEYRNAGITLPIVYPFHPEFTQYRPDPAALDGIRHTIEVLGRL